MSYVSGLSLTLGNVLCVVFMLDGEEQQTAMIAGRDAGLIS